MSHASSDGISRVSGALTWRIAHLPDTSLHTNRQTASRISYFAIRGGLSAGFCRHCLRIFRRCRTCDTHGIVVAQGIGCTLVGIRKSHPALVATSVVLAGIQGGIFSVVNGGHFPGCTESPTAVGDSPPLLRPLHWRQSLGRLLQL